MPQECERKFLVVATDWLRQYTPEFCHQGYLSVQKERTVRVRILGKNAFLTIKGENIKATCPEYEYSIPLQDAQEILENLVISPTIKKNRYTLQYSNHTWTVDVFLGDNAGLVLAEIELSHIDEPFDLPPWVTHEVTGDRRYFNSQLLKKPYATWNK